MNELQLRFFKLAQTGRDASALEEADKLLQQGIDVNIREAKSFGNTALLWAVANCNINFAVWLIANKDSTSLDLNAQDLHTGNTALHLAVGKGWNHTDDELEHPTQSDRIIRVTDALLEKGADPNIQDKFGCTPLHYAYLRGDINIVRKLRNFGAKDLPNQEGTLPQEMVRYSKQDTLAILKQKFGVYTAPSFQRDVIHALSGLQELLGCKNHSPPSCTTS